jgi:LEA14-like dessication related protein
MSVLAKPSLIRPLALAASLLVLAMAGCAALRPGLEPPEVSLVSLRPLAIESFEQRFAVTVRIANPNAVPLEVEGVDVVVEINDRRLARALSNEAFSVPRLGDQTVTLNATTNLLDLFRQAVSLPGEGGRLDYSLDGRILLAGREGWVGFKREGSLVDAD